MRRFLPLLLALALLLCALPTAASAAAPNGDVTAQIYDHAADAPGPATSLTTVRLNLDGAPLDGEMAAVIVGGRTLAPLRLLAEALGAAVEWLPDQTAQVRLTKGETTIALTLGAPTALVNGQSVPMPDSVPATLLSHAGQSYTMVPLRFFSETLGCTVSWDPGSYTAFVFTSAYIDPLLADLERPADPGRFLIAIDAGHGGSASGAFYDGVAEKTLTLSMARKLRSILAALGFQTTMTRDADAYVDLYDRAGMANALNADLFVSIHCNAADNVPDFQGLYVYHYPNSDLGAALARSVQTAATVRTGAVDRDVDHADFVVLRETDMPAVLVETGFMTCQEELARLLDDAYQTRMAQGVAQGIVQFLNKREKNRKSPLSIPDFMV